MYSEKARQILTPLITKKGGDNEKYIKLFNILKQIEDEKEKGKPIT